jgi:two-component system LytT family response regulator
MEVGQRESTAVADFTGTARSDTGTEFTIGSAQKNDNQRIALPTAEGIHFVQMADIIQCESLGSYTKFHLVKGPAIVVSRLLKEYEEILDNYYFFRVHQSNIINLEHIKRYVKGDGGQVWMSDNTEIEVSRRRKDEFLSLLSDFYVNSGKLK